MSDDGRRRGARWRRGAEPAADTEDEPDLPVGEEWLATLRDGLETEGDDAWRAPGPGPGEAAVTALAERVAALEGALAAETDRRAEAEAAVSALTERLAVLEAAAAARRPANVRSLVEETRSRWAVSRSRWR